MGSLRKTARHCAIAFGTGLLISAPAYAATFTTLASGLPNSLEISAVVGTTAYGATQAGGQYSGGTIYEFTPRLRKLTVRHAGP
jgi:hypothetical protein